MELNKAVIFLILSLGTACIARAQNDGAVAPDTPPARPAEADFSSAAPAARETPDRWKWLKNTYWYVPAPNLPAFLFDADREELTPVLDQTVFHITDYRDGYFWGRTVALLQLGGVANTSCLSLVGSVTPEGRVFLTFTPTTLKPETTVTQGFGEMRISKGQWTMEPQMSARSTARLQVIHWAYMIQCRPHEPSCQSLPGVGVSIDTLLRDCPGAPHLQQN